MAVIALVLIAIVTVVLIRKMINPIQGVLKAANCIAEGNFDINIEAKSEDEIGQLSKTFSGMTNNLKIIIQDIEYLLEEMSSGNFHVRTRAEELYAGIYRSILSAIHKNNRNLTKTLIKINQASDQVSNSSYQVSNASQELAKGATQQAASVEELSATIAESAEHIKTTAQNAEEARQLSKESSTYVLKCNQHMKDMMIAMDEITNTSNEIGKIIKTIDDIAFQTNILALNAAVEAARAGIAGKGFAVVAEEVRNLAQKSAEAAKNTTQLISSAILAIETGTKIADDTALSLQTVVGKTSVVAQKIDNIADAASQQEESIYQITAGVDLISSVVQTNSATAEESAAASEELNGQAQILKDLVADFTLSEDMTE
jgi:methyl-accepting chemotaxis protein